MSRAIALPLWLWAAQAAAQPSGPPLPAAVQQRIEPAAERPAPDVKDASYGPHPRHVLDVWKARAAKPTPLVIFLHGGGFQQGDKANVPSALLREALAAGLSVTSANYRLTNVAPFPAPMLDGVRAIQFLRSKAGEWNLDPARFAGSGTSAGAGIALWAAFHDDLARRDSSDPVERQSSRLACVGAWAGQSSYDPRFIRQHVGGGEISHPALIPFYGLPREELDTPRAHALFEQASPINYVTADDPPAFLFYRDDPPVPLPKDAPEAVVIHHSQLGVVLQEKMRALGIPCEVRKIGGAAGAERRDAVWIEMARALGDCLRRPLSR
jgi:acetyl esterase